MPIGPLAGRFQRYSYYLRRPIPRLETLDALRAYWEGDERVFVIVEQGRLHEARQVLGPLPPLETRAIGGNRAYLFSNGYGR